MNNLMIDYKFMFFVLSIIITRAIGPTVITQQNGNDSIPVDAKCYKAVGHDDIYMAVKFNLKIPRSPSTLGVFGTILLFDNNVPDPLIVIQLYFVLTNDRCVKSLEISNNNKQYNKITLDVIVHIGQFGRYKFTEYHIDIKPNIQRGWNPYPDSYGLMEIYARYIPDLPMVIPLFPRYSHSTLMGSVEQMEYNYKYICISFKADIFVIHPDFGDRSPMIPKYQGLKIRVYSDGKQVGVQRVTAWPCGSEFDSHADYKPILVVDDVPNREIYWTFEKFGVREDLLTVPLDELKRGTYFETDSQVELISYKSDWLLVPKRLFIVNYELHYLRTTASSLCSRYRSVEGSRNYLQILEQKLEITQKGYSYLNLQSVGYGTECDSFTSVTLMKSRYI